MPKRRHPNTIARCYFVVEEYYTSCSEEQYRTQKLPAGIEDLTGAYSTGNGRSFQLNVATCSSVQSE